MPAHAVSPKSVRCAPGANFDIAIAQSIAFELTHSVGELAPENGNPEKALEEELPHVQRVSFEPGTAQ